jgi:hypothetical protein
MSALAVDALPPRTCSEGLESALRVVMCMAQHLSLSALSGPSFPPQRRSDFEPKLTNCRVVLERPLRVGPFSLWCAECAPNWSVIKKFEFFLNRYLHRTDYSSERLNRLNQPNSHRVAAKSCDTAQRNTSISPVVSSTPLILKGNNAVTSRTLTRRVTCFIQLDDGDQR